MGALHAGHAALVDAARATCASVVVSVFVNPLQFGPNEDLATYPRTLDADVALCREHGADLVWAPSVADVYPDGGCAHPSGSRTVGRDSRRRVPAGSLRRNADRRREAARAGPSGRRVLRSEGLSATGADPAHDGRPRAACRDRAACRRFATPDGLALSSRNAYLSADERAAALALSRALFAGRDAAPGGALAVITAATAVLAAEPGVDVDYLELTGADLGEIPEHGAVPPARRRAGRSHPAHRQRRGGCCP